eukprot:5786887-Prymnesium_polylepis.1
MSALTAERSNLGVQLEKLENMLQSNWALAQAKPPLKAWYVSGTGVFDCEESAVNWTCPRSAIAPPIPAPAPPPAAPPAEPAPTDAPTLAPTAAATTAVTAAAAALASATAAALSCQSLSSVVMIPSATVPPPCWKDSTRLLSAAGALDASPVT